MAKITEHKGYQHELPDHPGYHVPKPDPGQHPDPNIVTVQDGLPLKYAGCEGIGVRVVHPSNPKAPAQNFGLVLFYLPPHVILEPSHHATEESYYIVEGAGKMTFANDQRDVKKGDFIHLPPWCTHGIENTGAETLVVLICTAPPNP